MPQPRLPRASFRELGPINWSIARVAAAAIRAPEMHLMTTLGRTKGLYRAWLYYSGRLMPFGLVNRRDSEIVILRVAHQRGSEYELQHHRRLGARAGLDAEYQQLIFAGPETQGLTDRDRALVRFVDDLLVTRDVADETWTAAARHWSDRQLVALCLLVTQYDGLATLLHTLRVPTDYPVQP